MYYRIRYIERLYRTVYVVMLNLQELVQSCTHGSNDKLCTCVYRLHMHGVVKEKHASILIITK